MTDNYHRVINYLRLSVTDRCNLRCIYCMPNRAFEFMPHKEILTYEEMLHIVRLCIQQGIRKVRLTGGEPLLRRGIIGFLKRLYHIKGLEEITLTTNGVLLKRFAADVRECGISRVNVSLDSLRPERFSYITGRDYFGQVWGGLEEAEHVGLNPIKINVVAMKGVNDDEILDFVDLALKKSYHVRFIEFMPIGKQNGWNPEKFVPIDKIYHIIQSTWNLTPVESNPYDGPAQRFKIEGRQGEIGLIGALSNCFCSRCNRLRLTSEGHLRGCLFSDQEVDLKTPLRQGNGDDHILRLIESAVKSKPKDHGLVEYGSQKCARQMYSIGG